VARGLLLRARMTAVRRLWWVAMLAGCEPQYGSVARNARVPHASVPLSSGQPLGRAAELSAGLANTADLVAPSIANHSRASEVPELEMRDELRFPIGTSGHGALIYERGFARTNQRLDDTQLAVGGGDVNGYGVATGYAWRTSTPGLVIGGRLEVMAWTMPYVERTVTDDAPSSNPPYVLHSREMALSLGVGVTPSYRRGRVTYFGGAYVRNQPTTVRESPNVELDRADKVINGPFNFLFHAGVEVAVTRLVSALIVIHQDVIADPVRYGPGVGAALTLRFGD